MGWKAVKEAYQIDHSVHVTSAGMCIGSAYIHNIIVIDMNGVIVKRDDGRSNKDLARYQREFDADPEKLKRLIQQEDTFEKSITVYTYSGGQIIEKQCEEIGWPNITHDGEMMHDNTFSTDKAEVVAWAKRNAKLGVRYAKRRIRQVQEDMNKAQSVLEAERADRAQLWRDYPRESTSVWCSRCGVNPADQPSGLCPGCAALRDANR